MPLNPYQVDWIGRIKESPVTDETMAETQKKVQARGEYLGKMRDALDRRRGDIDTALGKFSITNTVETKGRERVWRAITLQSRNKDVEIPWRAGEGDREGQGVRADFEVDTKEDLRFTRGEDNELGTHDIPQDKVDKLVDVYAALNELQQDMISQVDDDGNRLFSDDDIRRELWTPLVREGLIPDNIVPDKFSEEAIAFAGAKSMYDEKLKDFTKKSTGKEGLVRALGIGQEVLNVATAGASGIATIVNADSIAKLNQELLNSATSPERKLEIGKEILALQAPNATVLVAGSVLSGGLGVTKTWVENSAKSGTDDQWWAKAADATAGILIDIVTKAVTAGVSFGGNKAMAGMAGNGVMAGLNTLRIGFAIYQVSQEQDPNKRMQLLASIGGKIGDTIGNSLQIYANSVMKAAESKTGLEQAAMREHATEMGQIAQGVSSAVKSAANGPVIYKMLQNGRYKEAALLLGGSMVQLSLAGASEQIIDGLRKDVTSEEMSKMSPEERLFAEVGVKPVNEGTQQVDVKDSNGKPTGEKRDETQDETNARVQKEKEAIAKYEQRQNALAETVMKSLSDAQDKLSKSTTSDIKKRPEIRIEGNLLDDMQKEIEDQTIKAKQELVKDELAKAFTPEAVEEMFKEFDVKMKGYDTLYADAYPVTDLEGTPDTDVEKAMAAINRAIERTSELRAKAELINGVTSATAGVIGAIIPGAGAVVAAQKVAFDIYQLVQHVQAHNKWVKSMEVAYRSNSAYSSGIEKTLQNAEITLSQTSVRLVLDTLNLGAQVGRCFDPTGGATIAGASLTLAQALVDFGYKMHKEREISRGWALYQDALENPGNRKRARKAIRGNSTLAKCVIAYGACVVGDPVAKEAVRRCGLSPEVLANDKDVCKALITYLENELNDDPTVLHVDRKAKDWMPDLRPYLTLPSWMQFKKAAHISATPKLAAASLKTDGIDKLLAQLGSLWGGKASFVEAMVPVGKLPDSAPVEDRKKNAEARKKLCDESEAILAKLETAFTSYIPVQDGPGSPHKDFVDVTKTMTQLVKMNRAMVKKEKTAAEADEKKALEDEQKAKQPENAN